MVGMFTLDRPLDLDAASAVTITHLLSDGGHDVTGLPLTLSAECCNNAKTAYFKTAVGAVPIAKVTIGSRGRGEFTLRIDVTQATSEPSEQCPDPTLITALLVHAVGQPPVAVATQQPWLCFGTGDQYLKSPQ